MAWLITIMCFLHVLHILRAGVLSDRITILSQRADMHRDRLNRVEGIDP